MVVRIEKTKNNQYLVIDELEKYIGRVNSYDFAECLEDRESFQEDLDTFYYVNKFCLMSKLL